MVLGLSVQEARKVLLYMYICIHADIGKELLYPESECTGSTQGTIYIYTIYTIYYIPSTSARSECTGSTQGTQYYLLYWYKSFTGTKVQKLTQVGLGVEEARKILKIACFTGTKVQKLTLFWYKIAKTDAKGAASVW